MTGNKKLFLDTNILIYLSNKEFQLSKKVEHFFSLCTTYKIPLAISTLTIAEYLVNVYKNKDSDLSFFIFLEASNIEIIPLSIEIAKKAAQLRANYQEKIPDMVHIATAIEHKYDFFISEDIKLKKVIELPILNIQEFLDLFQK